MQSTQTKLSEREIADAWDKITIQLWRKNLARMKIGQNSSGDLNRSFKYKVIAGARGNVERIEFAFNYYGKFLDMGVGKGTKLADRPVSRGSGIKVIRALFNVRIITTLSEHDRDLRILEIHGKDEQNNFYFCSRIIFVYFCSKFS